MKKILGIIWMALSFGVLWYLVTVLGWPKFISSNQADLVFGTIILFILTPIIFGSVFTFGLFSFKGEYDHEDLDEEK